MKYLIFILSFLSANIIAAQTEDQQFYETFEMTEGDTTYVMKKYYMVFLKPGPNRDQSEEEAAEIQRGHMAHMNKLAEEKKICMAGPFDSDGSIAGMVIYSCFSKEEAERLTQMDPAVKAGRLLVEIHPFWAAMGSKLF